MDTKVAPNPYVMAEIRVILNTHTSYLYHNQKCLEQKYSPDHGKMVPDRVIKIIPNVLDLLKGTTLRSSSSPSSSTSWPSNFRSGRASFSCPILIYVRCTKDLRLRKTAQILKYDKHGSSGSQLEFGDKFAHIL